MKIICIVLCLLFLIPLASATNFTVGNGTTNSNVIAAGYTSLDTDHKSFPQMNGTIYTITIFNNPAGSNNYKLVSFYNNGTSFIYRNTSQNFTLTSVQQYTNFTLPTPFFVASDETVGIYGYSGYTYYNATASGTVYYKLGLIETTSLITSWSSTVGLMSWKAFGNDSTAGNPAPTIISFAPSSPNSTYQNIPATFNITTDQTTNITWTINGSSVQTNTSVTSASYTNSTAVPGTYTVLANASNANGSATQSWTWTVLPNSVDIVITYEDRTNLSYNVIWNVSNITAGTQHWNVSWNGTDAGNTYYFRYWNGTYIGINQTASSTNQTLWFNYSGLLPAGQYYISETSGSLPNITSWQNNKTLNTSLDFTINTSEFVKFNITSNQSITTYNWYVNGANQNNNFDNFTLSWGTTGLKIVIVNATNANGTSNSIQWNVTVQSTSSSSSITIPANSWGMFNNWSTYNTTFVNIAANESNDVTYTYYNTTSGEWETYYIGYTFNQNNPIGQHNSVLGFFNAQTTITANTVTPSNTSLLSGWNMLYVEGTSNRTLSAIKTNIQLSCTVSDIYKYNTTLQDYSNTLTESLQPNEGFLVYVDPGCTWTRTTT